MEPWLKPLTREVGANHRTVLEVGSGQGIDGYQIAASLGDQGRYVGIDYSDESVRAAQTMWPEASRLLNLRNRPTFLVGSALTLDQPDNTFDCVFSIGVMHHTPSPQTCFDEAFRVLRPSGVAYIALYRKPSPKVAIAKALRAAQRVADLVTGRDRVMYHRLLRRTTPRKYGTMLLECFGVPHMAWFSRREIEHAFRKFRILEFNRVGYNLPLINPDGNGYSRFGYMWLVKAQKP
jgi:ubiquinone/menaquinone biosynthesis C-methylase UbiE